jgi:PAS domain S-box-containing protein
MTKTELIKILKDFETLQKLQFIDKSRMTVSGLDGMEKALKESEQTVKELLNIPIYIMALVDTEGKFLVTNEMLAKKIGKRADELIGKTFADFFPPHIAQNRAFIFQEVIKTCKYIRFEDYIDSICYDNIFYPICNLNGQVGKIAMFSIDVTELKISETERFELEKKLLHSQKMEAIGTLASGIAHDFNNILGVIMGYTEIVIGNIRKDSPDLSHLENVLIAVIRAKELVKQILTFSRQTENKKKPVQISTIIEEAIKFIRASIPANIEIRKNIDDKYSVVFGDPIQIHQIILNLFTNAYYTMRNKGGIMEVSLKNVQLYENDIKFYDGLTEGDYVKLSVKDGGSGIDKLVMERIFEPYFTTKPPGEGTGMGLSVVQGIVKSHGGDIKVYSKRNEGTVFEIYLPRIKTLIEPEVRIVTHLPTGKGRILFIDDEAELVNISKMMLEKLGYEVTGKTDSLEALEEFSRDINKFDLVITDFYMPHISGDELARKLLQLRPDLPIIICTGDIDEHISNEKLNDIIIRGFIKKPFNSRIIAETVYDILTDK